MLSIDWLQINVTPPKGSNFEYNLQRYTIIRHDKHTPVFKTVEEIIDNEYNKTIAWVTRDPKMETLNPDLCIIKFENYWLYRAKLIDNINEFLQLNNMQFKGFTRLDISHDFNKFDNDLHPKEFIQRYLNGTYVKTDKSNFCVHGKDKGVLDLEYVRWGSNNSNLVYYLYNKSNELFDKTDKPYIRDLWKANGLKGNVWRLEFRLRGSQVLLLDTYEGVATRLNELGLDLLNKDSLIIFYKALFNKYMDFRLNDGNTNVTRSPKLVLFDKIRAYRHVIINHRASKCENTRTDKVFIKEMCLFENWAQTHIPDWTKDIENKNFVYKLVAYRIGFKGLQDWALEKEFIPDVIHKMSKVIDNHLTPVIY
jgi:hypothetical protein